MGTGRVELMGTDRVEQLEPAGLMHNYNSKLDMRSQTFFFCLNFHVLDYPIWEEMNLFERANLKVWKKGCK